MPRLPLLLLLALASCQRQHPEPLPAPEADAYARALSAAGFPARVELLPGRRETPRCAPAGSRFRLHFGDEAFVNVSIFAAPKDARACWEDYRDVVSKGGQAAWDRLAPLAVLEGRVLLLFPDTVTDPAQRAQVVQALRGAE